MKKQNSGEIGTKMGDCRPSLSSLGEYYGDRLAFEAWLKKGTLSGQATSLLRNCLNKRVKPTDEKLTYLAMKRGISLAELQKDILLGEAKNMTDAEYAELVEGFGADTDD